VWILSQLRAKSAAAIARATDSEARIPKPAYIASEDGEGRPGPLSFSTGSPVCSETIW
jgi:hypothetical protein